MFGYICPKLPFEDALSALKAGKKITLLSDYCNSRDRVIDWLAYVKEKGVIYLIYNHSYDCRDFAI